MEKVIQEKIPSGGFFFFFFCKGGGFFLRVTELTGTPQLSPVGLSYHLLVVIRHGLGEEGWETGIFSFLLQKREESPGPPVSRSARREVSLGDGKIVEVVEVREKISRFNYSPLRQPMEGGLI